MAADPEDFKKQKADELIAAMERMAAVDDPPIMSPEDMVEEIAVMRAEKRAKRG